MQSLPQEAANLDCLPFDVALLAFVPLVRQMNHHNEREAAVMAHHSPRGKRTPEAEIPAAT
ncbi:hypothetical protein [Psychrobacillus sp. OK032]|uniref:hypothetical protein n=1 Tax=Psychrobacillus sp. OK032 TaxID=1884358 RepID=UPI000B8217E5|nr:hypothetical protein [Psychrobacillus sp. OK032]